MAAAYKALANPVRRQVLKVLADGAMCAGDLAARFAISQPSMSSHFALLRAARLVEVRRCGKTVMYSLQTAQIEQVAADVLALAKPRRRRPAPRASKKAD